jgi:hypothetical protein
MYFATVLTFQFNEQLIPTGIIVVAERAPGKP